MRKYQHKRVPDVEMFWKLSIFNQSIAKFCAKCVSSAEKNLSNIVNRGNVFTELGKADVKIVEEVHYANMVELNSYVKIVVVVLSVNMGIIGHDVRNAGAAPFASMKL